MAALLVFTSPSTYKLCLAEFPKWGNWQSTWQDSLYPDFSLLCWSQSSQPSAALQDESQVNVILLLFSSVQFLSSTRLGKFTKTEEVLLRGLIKSTDCREVWEERREFCSTWRPPYHSQGFSLERCLCKKQMLFRLDSTCTPEYRTMSFWSPSAKQANVIHLSTLQHGKILVLSR